MFYSVGILNSRKVLDCHMTWVVVSLLDMSLFFLETEKTLEIDGVLHVIEGNEMMPSLVFVWTEMMDEMNLNGFEGVHLIWQDEVPLSIFEI